MSTRGLIGIRKKSNDYLTYNHGDSYPSYLGVNLLKELRGVSRQKLSEAYDKITLVNPDGKPTHKPTQEQIAECKKYGDLGVSEQTEEDWYCLLRNSQGTFVPYLKGELKYMIDNRDFIADSLFCEWAYIVNLDTDKFEVWKGFQQSPTDYNRYGTEKNEGGYYPCKLVKEYDLDKLPTKAKFLKDMKKFDEDE